MNYCIEIEVRHHKATATLPARTKMKLVEHGKTVIFPFDHALNSAPAQIENTLKQFGIEPICAIAREWGAIICVSENFRPRVRALFPI
jgi:DhnA family fructose-bisphosphate aldolase class Ia